MLLPCLVCLVIGHLYRENYSLNEMSVESGMDQEAKEPTPASDCFFVPAPPIPRVSIIIAL